MILLPQYRTSRRAATAAASYPLDGYSANLWAAWAPYRLLTSFSGAYIRVRRASDNAEADCASDAAIASHCGASKGYVVTLYDQTGNSRNATQTTSGEQPEVYNGSAVITTVGGMPCAEYDGANDNLACPSMASSGLTTIEMFGAARRVTDPASNSLTSGGIFFTNTVNGSAGQHHPWTDGSVYDATFRGTRASAGNPTDALTSDFVWGVLSVTSGNLTIWINSQQLHNAATGSFSVTHQSNQTYPTIGRGLNQASPSTKYCFYGAIGAVLLYSADKSSDRTAIRGAIL